MIAEDLLLLFLDDETGSRRTDETRFDYGLGGALLIELALAGRVCVDDDPKPRRRRVEVLDPGPTGDELLDRALAVIGEKPRKAVDLVPRLRKGARRALLDRLVARGVLREDADRVLGIFPRHRWPTVDSSHEAEVRQRLRGVLLDGVTPDESIAALIALLASLDQAPKVLGDLDRPTRHAVRDRAKEIAEGDWTAEATRAAVRAAQDATAAAVISAVVVTGAGASS